MGPHPKVLWSILVYKKTSTMIGLAECDVAEFGGQAEKRSAPHSFRGVMILAYSMLSTKKFLFITVP
jgi:hypothetical protein